MIGYIAGPGCSGVQLHVSTWVFGSAIAWLCLTEDCVVANFQQTFVWYTSKWVSTAA